MITAPQLPPEHFRAGEILCQMGERGLLPFSDEKESFESEEPKQYTSKVIHVTLPVQIQTLTSALKKKSIPPLFLPQPLLHTAI